MDARDRYFSLLENVIYSSNYLILTFQKHQGRHRKVECTMAVLSSLSLAGWLLYNKFMFLYAAVIVLTQLINSILPTLGIAKREEALRYAVTEYQPVVRQAEMGWRRIESENISDKDMETMMQNLELAEATVLDKLTQLAIKDDPKTITAASLRADKYMKSFFPAKS